MSDSRDRLIQEDLVASCHFQREWKFMECLKIDRSTMSSQLTVLDTRFYPPHRDNDLRVAFNKPTAFYFEQNAQCGCYDSENGYLYIYRKFIAATYEIWRALSGLTMNIEFGHFLANPVRITKRGPRTLGEIITAHETLCEMARTSGLEDEDHTVLESYPEIIVVCDQDLYLPEDEDGLMDLRKWAEQVTVLVMSTRAASASKFRLADPEPHALPLDRSDAEGIDVRRVPLAIGIKFIMEVEASLETKKAIRRYDMDLSRCI